MCKCMGLGVSFSWMRSVDRFPLIHPSSSSSFYYPTQWLSQDAVPNSSGSLCCWCGVSDSGEDEMVLLQGRATFLSVQHSRSHHPNHFFNRLNNAFIKLIGNDKKSRLKLKPPYERGDLGLSNLKWVYCSAQLCSTIFYFSTESLSAWVNIKQTSVANLPLKLC